MSTKNCESTSSFDTSNDSALLSNEDLPGSSENRSNFRGTKIARRARSFKDDFFEKISQMRTPTNTISRSHSPKGKNTPKMTRDDSSKPAYDLNYHAKLFKHAITHFKDVVNKNKLEMLHGNGTIVLESIANIHSALKAQKMNEQSSAIYTSQQQVHHSLGNLIKLCDDALLSDNEENFIALNKENVKDIIENLDQAVDNLIKQANKKTDSTTNKNFQENEVEQRSSLPDIPLTKWEKEDLENTMMQNAHSSESLLHGVVPPPKPSKDHKPSAPPIPPKRKTLSIDEVSDEMENFHQSPSRPEVTVSCNVEFPRWDDDNDGDGFRNIIQRSSFNSMPNPAQFDQVDFLSRDMQECRIKISQEMSSQVQKMSSRVHELDNSFSFMAMNQSNRFVAEQNVTSSENICLYDSNEEQPPPLPVKTRSRSLRLEQHKSVYDNVEDMNRNSLDTKASTTSSNSSLTSSLSARTESAVSDYNFHQTILKNKYKSCIESSFGIDRNADGSENPPPLPLKKKHIMAYMEIFGNASHTNHGTHEDTTLMRHSMHSFTHSSRFQSQTSSGFQSTLMPKNSQFIPPALPPKKQKLSSSNASLNNIIITPPISPKVSNISVFAQNKHEEKVEEESPVVNNKPSNEESVVKESPKTDIKENESVVLRKKPANLMEELDVQEHLIFKKDGDDGPSVLIGGRSDALIIHASKNSTQKSGEAFGEAFLATFRTFIDPDQLIEKLIYRYSYFNCQNNDLKQRAGKESFSLLVRTVNDLTSPDLSPKLMEKLIKFVYDLVCGGELLMAKLLRVKIIEKTFLLRQKNLLGPNYLPSRPVMSNPPSLIDLKSTDIAEQMTILDSELFQKIEIPEVLIWAQEQCEERSPNLTLFTAHFNKLSYWARTQILKQQDAKDREKHVMKFIKIMKHLRKINNFNSYLALLSALDSAPIRRLEWQKNITEGLKEYCALIDSSSSFRAYRQALSETNPPCIPYIGLVLQDLTFVHIGNPDYLPDGSINFSKRWQQYNIVINMKRFRNSLYSYKKNERIIGFFDNFDEYFDEDAMWHISEKIKPRGKKVLSN